MTDVIRLICIADAAELAALLTANRDPPRPLRADRGDDVEVTAAASDRRSRTSCGSTTRNGALPHVIVEDGRIAGRVTLSTIVRGPFQSASLGYWVDGRAGGRGLATGAVAEIVRIAFRELGLHRIDAGTLVDNVRFAAGPGEERLPAVRARPTLPEDRRRLARPHSVPAP